MRSFCIQCTRLLLRELGLNCGHVLTSHSLHAEDLAFLMGMQQKDLRKLCARLREDRLIGVYGSHRIILIVATHG